MVRFETANETIIINIFMSRSLVTCFFTNPSDQKICASQIGSPSPRIGIKHTRLAKHLHNANGYSPRKRHFPYQGTFEDPFPFPQGRSFFFPVKGQVEVTSPKKSCEPKSFIFFLGGVQKLLVLQRVSPYKKSNNPPWSPHTFLET